jgi:hypothetical protein
MKTLLTATAVFTLAAAAMPATAQGNCRAQSAATPPAVVELYTSEGCSSCPPADRWASRLKGREDVLVLAFHVNYWDKLGWPDRFANAATTERQHQVQRANALPYVYTPQVVLNGRDLRAWSGATLARPPASTVGVVLEREGASVRARIDAPAGAALGGYWAVLEDGHSSRVKAGENAGETLKHDHVVTLYQPVAAWRGSQALTLALPAAGAAARRVAFVVTDANGARPLQAIALAC